MLKMTHYLRDSKHLTTLYTLLVLLGSVWGIILLSLRIINSDHFLNAFVTTLVFFTTQSNILVFVITILFLLNFHNKKWFNILSFITLVNIFITGLIFNTILGPYMGNLDLIQYVLHTINPILYIILYYIFIPTKIDLKHSFIGIIFPAVYIIAVYTLIEPYLGNYIFNTFNEFDGSRFVYPFLDPNYYEVYEKVTLFYALFLLGLSATILTFLLNILKNKLENSILNM
jgi:hypothetical protein